MVDAQLARTYKPEKDDFKWESSDYVADEKLNGIRARVIADGNGNNEMDAGEIVYWAWNSANHTNGLIPLYVYGAGADLFAAYVAGTDPVRGDYVDNTAVYHVMRAIISRRTYLPLAIRP